MVAHARVVLNGAAECLINYRFIRSISVFDRSDSLYLKNPNFSSRKLPTVSTIINRTLPIENLMILRKWQEKMRRKMGDQEFNDYVTRIKALGKDVHQAICDILQGGRRADEFVGPIDGYIRSLETVLPYVKGTLLVEHDCFHPLLRYRGRLDSISSFKTPGTTGVNDSGFILAEWKTVHESKRVTSLEKAYDAPLQVAAYTAAYNFTRSDMPQVRQGLIAYAYADGYPADLLILNEDALEHYFQVWRSRVEAYYQSLSSADR